MSTSVQRRRGTTAQHASFAGLNGELTVDTDKEVVVVHDGSTAGGYPQMRENGSNSALALGSAATPSLKFAGDTNTGIYSPGADQLALATNGTGRLFIDSSGNVGIGKTPGATLDVNGPIYVKDNGTTAINFYKSTGVALGTIKDYADFFTIRGENKPLFLTTVGSYPLQFGSGQSEHMRIDTSGRVGVGTSSPTRPLHIKSAANVGIYLEENTSGNTVQYFLFNSSNGTVYNATAGVGNGTHQFQIDGTERVRIDGSGRVGIGTTSPSELLEVNGVIRRTNSSSAGYYFRGYRNSTTSAFYIYDDGTDIQLTNEQSGALQFRTANAERARIDSSGRLLVGTSSDSGGALLQVNGDRIRVGTAKTPASATATGTTGEICWDTSYIYVCTAANTWKRAALSTW